AGGAYGTFEEKLGVSFGSKTVNGSLFVSRLDTEGISAANSNRAGNEEEDGYKNTTISTRLGFTPSDYVEFDFFLRYVDAEADLDIFGGPLGDDPNYVQEFTQQFVKGQTRISLFDDLWEQRFGLSFSRYQNKEDNPVDPDHPSDLIASIYKGTVMKWDWQNNLYLSETNTLTFGVDLEEEKGKFDYYSESIWGPFLTVFPTRSAQTNGYYIQDYIKLWDRWITTVGARVDDHEKFGSKTTYRVASAYLIPQTGTKLKATYGTGFKAPTLYQLYSQFGDETLAAETSVGWDVGVEQSLFHNKMRLGITYFRNDFKNLIDFDGPSFSFKNIAEAETKGFEVFASARPTKNLTVTANYTNTGAKDKTTNEALIRRPKNKYSLGLNYRFLEKGNVNLNVIHVGKRPDKFFDNVTYATTDVTLDAYTLVNVALSYNICTDFQVFGRVGNLLDEDYEDVAGYGTQGFSFMLGLKASF
ncbi:MAG: TonB-dependent receptor, partial [Deltaproteobacteria bacterium]|nr:TonB-dependent receptor [Deltaproteobacteria bacterium]MBW2323965.1 TonB-dependent receptor [Deltaproteobacteria bacterium]